MNTLFAAAATWMRRLAIALSCALVIVTAAAPALAIGSTPSRPDQGTAVLDEVYTESKKAVQPENALRGDKMRDRANQGLNEVQKDADLDKMNHPGNSNQATAPMDQIKDALSNVMP